MILEYKCRGKRIDNGKWAEGYPCENEYSELSIQQIVHKIKDGFYVPYRVYPIIPETLGLYSGLKDKNGREIYKGDILRVTEYENIAISLCLPKEEIESTSLEDCKYQKRNSFTGEAVFSESCFFVEDTYLSAFHGDQRFSQPIFEVEILGNIYDNPELLKVE